MKRDTWHSALPLPLATMSSMSDEIRVRRIRPQDAAQLERLYAELDQLSRERRFLDPRGSVDARAAAAFASVDHQRRDGFVALDGARVVGHLALEPRGGGVDELAIVVDAGARHQHVGSLLMAAAFASARLRSTRSIVAWVLVDNDAARHLMESTHHPARLFWEGGLARYEIETAPHPPPGPVPASAPG
jgi:ribosomal protein S18 acetylase RimI-like enzyme